MTNTPAVSVIIPMFNASQFVGQCLESLLAQTFQDFEVIVVDDLSTDSSAAIVENYASKFDGRLALLQLDRNTGSGAVPRNTGLKFAHGEYVYFVDADDLLTLTALKELHALAKDFDADVVYCEKYYAATSDLSEIVIHSEQEADLVTRPTFESDDLAVRVDEILQRKFLMMPWSKFTRRDLLIENELFFPPVVISEDDIWTFGLLFHAKKFLRVPNVVYVWRKHKDSMCGLKRTPQQFVTFLLNPVIFGLKTLNQFMERAEFFRQNPRYRYAFLEYFIDDKTDCLVYNSSGLPSVDVYETALEHFGKNFGEHDMLICALFAFIHNCQKRLRNHTKELNEKNALLKNLSEQFQRTIDAQEQI